MINGLTILLISLFSVFTYASSNYDDSHQQIRTPLNQEMLKSDFITLAKKVDSKKLATLPVLDRGRIKPFDTFTKETLLFITGKKSMWGLDSIQLYIALASFEGVERLELINLRYPEVRGLLAFDKKKRFVSLQALMDAGLQKLADPALKQEKENKNLLSAEQKNIIETLQQTWAYQGVIYRSHFFGAITFIQNKDGFHNHNEESEAHILAKNYLRALASNQPIQVIRDWEEQLSTKLPMQTMPEELKSSLKKLETEVIYNQVRPFLWSGILYLIIAILIFLPFFNKNLNDKIIFSLLSLPLILIFYGFVIRIYITQFPPVTNMYGTMLWVAFGISTFSSAFYYLYKNKEMLAIMSFGAAIILILTESIPLILSPDMDPIVAVLRSGLWLTIHVLSVTISYAAFSMAMLFGNAALIKILFSKDQKANSKYFKKYAHYAYRSIQLGVFLITVGIILGGVWADYSWGRFWGWDPKETWALIADLGYLAILHSRFIGWLKPLGILVSSTLAYLLVIMAWYGVNFILATGLHSYGFSSGGTAIVISFVVIQLSLVALAMSVHYSRQKKHPNDQL